MKPQNPNCDGSHCRSKTGEVRKLPTGGSSGSNIIYCRACYEHEMAYRRDRNASVVGIIPYPLPKWEDLEVYEGC